MPERSRVARDAQALVVSRRTLLAGVIAGAGRSTASMASPGSARDGDAPLLAACDAVHRLEAEDGIGGPDEWDAAVRHVATTPARTSSGLLAKALLVRTLMPASAGLPEKDRENTTGLEDQLLWSLLDDILAET